MSLLSFIGAIELGLIYALLAFGIYISFRILKIPDLTTDGSFVLGTAVSAMFAINGMPYIGVFAAMLAGVLAGIVTAVQQTKLGIQPVLSGILTATALYTINLMVMGGAPNISLLQKRTVFTAWQALLGKFVNTSGQNAGVLILYKLIPLLIVTAIAYVMLNLFFKTQLGISIRATGDNEIMVRASSIDTDAARIVAFAIANAMVALSGALFAQMQQSTDINVGSGMIVVGLASLIIGQVVVRGRGLWLGLVSVIVGAVLYRLLIALILNTSLPPSYLKLISALVVITAVSVPVLKKKLGIADRMRKEVR